MFWHTSKVLCLFSLSLFSLSSLAEQKVYIPNQTSASYLVKQAEFAMNHAEEADKKRATQKHMIIYDIYIKARSYAILNKIFFFLSVAFAIAVLVWPSITVIFDSRLDKWKWIKSATVQTTVTGIAALSFAFYSQYKDKQVYAESLMRHVLYSEEPIQTISVKVSEELSRIDRGFSFNSVISKEEQ